MKNYNDYIVVNTAKLKKIMDYASSKTTWDMDIYDEETDEILNKIQSDLNDIIENYFLNKRRSEINMENLKIDEAESWIFVINENIKNFNTMYDNIKILFTPGTKKIPKVSKTRSFCISFPRSLFLETCIKEEVFISEYSKNEIHTLISQVIKRDLKKFNNNYLYITILETKIFIDDDENFIGIEGYIKYGLKIIKKRSK